LIIELYRVIHQIDDTPYYAVVKAQICWKNVGVAFIRKWRLRHRPVPVVWRKLSIASSPSRACRGANGEAREQQTRSSLHEEFKRRIQNAVRIVICRYCGDVVLGAARLCQINMRKVDGWRTLARKSIDQPIDLAA
jgi:putative transposase